MSKGRAHRNLAAFAMGDTSAESHCEWAAIDDNGFGAIHALCELEESSDASPERFRSFVLLAIACGASPTRGEHELNNAPLHWCAWHAAPGCALALLESGAPWNARNRNGDSAMDIAKRQLSSRNSMRPECEKRLHALVEAIEAFKERTVLADAIASPNEKASLIKALRL